MARLSPGNQVTVPAMVGRQAGLSAGDRLVVWASGPGRIQVEGTDRFVARCVGSIPDPEGYLDRLRHEWER